MFPGDMMDSPLTCLVLPALHTHRANNTERERENKKVKKEEEEGDELFVKLTPSISPITHPLYPNYKSREETKWRHRL